MKKTIPQLRRKKAAEIYDLLRDDHLLRDDLFALFTENCLPDEAIFSSQLFKDVDDECDDVVEICEDLQSDCKDVFKRIVEFENEFLKLQQNKTFILVRTTEPVVEQMNDMIEYFIDEIKNQEPEYHDVERT